MCTISTCDTIVDRDVEDIQNCIDVMSIGIRIGAVFENSSNKDLIWYWKKLRSNRLMWEKLEYMECLERLCKLRSSKNIVF